jgi:hypothetical protein
MEKAELWDIDPKSQVAYLNGRIEAGVSFEGVCAELDTDHDEMNKHGIYWVTGMKKFMARPMKGFRTTKMSGWEEHRNK